jgi:hypothetical protein
MSAMQDRESGGSSAGRRMAVSIARYRSNEPAVFRFTSLPVSMAKEEARMGKLSFIAVLASAMWALPASASDAIPFKPEVTLAQLLDLCAGPDCRERDRIYRDDRNYYNWRYYRGGTCRDVEIREQRGGEIVVRHVRRCD